MSEWYVDEYDQGAYVRELGKPSTVAVVWCHHLEIARQIAADHNAARAAVEREAKLREAAEHARASALLLNSGCDDHALQDRILDYLGEILGPLPGLAATAPQQQEDAGGDGTACADCNEPIIKDHMSAEDGHRYHLDCNPPEGLKTRLELI